MKANCLPRRHSRCTDTHVTYGDPFPLAQWQRNSCRDSRLVAKPAPPTGAVVLHPGAGDGERYAARRQMMPLERTGAFTHGYEATREAAMAELTKSWRQS